ncbi:tetratricopeptide repeat protein [Massilia glaciei]|uniref:tetratricopeptide repeat protein n=1 Tax=Massilia glaciei TaxID=1524097 RepID=UPI0015E7F298|nr:tetratricopeptide repeat protein [Massilia glaciei]
MLKRLLLVFLFVLPFGACAKDSLADTAIDAALDKPAGLYNLGVEFYTGKRVAKDLSKSAKLWQKAAALGVVSAKNNLGFLLFTGKGIEQDRSKAVALWRDAASQGHDEAQLHLGEALFDGEGIRADRTTGAAWVLSAQKHAALNKDAAMIEMTSTASSRLVAALTKDERKRAHSLAMELFQRHPAPKNE